MNHSHAVRPLLPFFAQLVSKVVIYNVCQRIEIPRDIDAELCKPGFRALMIILAEVKFMFCYPDRQRCVRERFCQKYSIA